MHRITETTRELATRGSQVSKTERPRLRAHAEALSAMRPAWKIGLERGVQAVSERLMGRR